jgi:Icc protein
MPQSSTQKSTRIALCCDTHFWPNSARQFGATEGQLQPHSRQIQEVLLAELQAASPDLIFHLGDLTCGGGAFEMPDVEFYATVDETVAAFQALPGEFSILPGNHDCPANGGDWTYLEQKTGLEPGLGKTIDLPAARLVLLNAQGHSPQQIADALPSDPTYGWVSPAELARLDTALASAGERPVLLFVHQLLQSWSGEQEWKDLYGVQNAAEVLTIMARYNNVRAVFQAHAHRLNVQRVNKTWFVVSPAIIEYPLAWLQLDLSAGALQVTMKQLPLPNLARLSLKNSDEPWRAGQPDWRESVIQFSEG